MTDTLNSLLSPLYASAAMRAVMSDRARLQRMLDFEAALARAEAAVGIISASGAVEIAEACHAERYDLSLLMDASSASDLATAVVEALTEEVARSSKSAAASVHWGASNQDVVDTALVLEMRAAIDALLADLDRAIKSFTGLAVRHRRALVAARVQMRHALPVPVGLKLAGYAAALARGRERLVRLRREALMLQFGGTAGTLAFYAEHGLAVTDRLAALLDLPIPEAPWHSHRDRLAELGAGFAILAGSCGKVARDLSLMMQIEVGEAAESAAGTNGAAKRDRLSSVAAAAVSAAAAAPNLAASLIAAQAQEHERGLADGLTEWTALPMLALLTSGAVEAVARMAEGLEIDVDRMRSNLDLSRGRIMAEAAVFTLTEKIGRMEAQTVVQELSARAEQEDRPLKELLLQDPRVTAELTNVEVEKMLIPLTYQGSAQFFLDRLMVAAQGRSARRTDFRPEARPAAAPPTPPPQTTAAAVSPPQTIVAGPTTAPDAPAPQPPAANVQPSSQPARLPPAPTIDPPETGASAEPELPLGVTAPPVAAEPASADRAEATSSEPNSLADVEPVTLAVAEAAAPAPSAPDPEPANDDAPGAFMDILSRAEAETRALAEARAREAKRDRS